MTDNQYIYCEGEEIASIYFLKDGPCFYVLPKYHNVKFIRINTKRTFGFSDIIGSIIKNEDVDKDNWISSKEKLTGQCTIASGADSFLLLLSIIDVNRMQHEFVEVYEKLIQESYLELECS